MDIFFKQWFPSKLLLLLLFCCTLLFHAHPLQAIKSQPSYDIKSLLKQFEPHIIATMEAWDVPGLAVAIVEHGKIVYIKGFGIRKQGHREKIDAHTVFQICSVSKTFTAGLLGVLKDQGKIKYDSPIRHYFPSLKFGQGTTVRHLLSHTGGWPAHTGDYEVEQGKNQLQLRKKLQDVKLTSQPGKTYAYQNVAYLLLGDIIAHATHLDYANALKTYLFRPLGMKNASVGYAALKKSANRAFPHSSKGRRYLGRYTVHYYNVAPAAGINASIEDMAQWLKFCMGDFPKLVHPKTLKELYEPLVKTPHELKRVSPFKLRIKSTSYGLGFRIYDYAGKKMLFHAGLLNGFRSVFAFLPQEDVGIVILTNGGGSAASVLRSQFFDMYLRLPPKDWNSHLKKIYATKKLKCKRKKTA